MGLDVAIIENGNGGDFQIGSNDLRTIFSIENQVYLAWFGGNKKEVTQVGKTKAQSFDYWANNLLFGDIPSQQFNSLTESTLDKVAVNSEGRTILESAMKKDLEYMRDDIGAEVNVNLSIISDDRWKAVVKIILPTGDEKIIIVTFRKVSVGDFWYLDFNDDFFV